MRLYFLPRTQSVPPYNPPKDILDKSVVFECLAPEEAKIVNLAMQNANGTDEAFDDIVVVNRCWKGKCDGRWKPARARHCSECGVCRAGFDHHCAFVSAYSRKRADEEFANCLTTPYMPSFLLMLLLAPTALIILCLPIYRPFGRRFLNAMHLSRADEQFSWWWDWWPSWIVAGGPLGRYGGAIVLAWREIDRRDGGGLFRLSTGVLIVFGLFLTGIASVSRCRAAMIDIQALAYTTVRLIRAGHLTIDRERARAHSRTQHAIDDLHAANRAIPEGLTASLKRFAEIKHFFIPLNDIDGDGEIVATLAGENPYDLGIKGNWEAVMGEGIGWLLPWKAIRRGMGDEIYNWPISSLVKARLITEAKRRRGLETDT